MAKDPSYNTINPERKKLIEIIEKRIKEYESLHGKGSWERDNNFTSSEVYERICEEYSNDFSKKIESKKRPDIPKGFFMILLDKSPKHKKDKLLISC